MNDPGAFEEVFDINDDIKEAIQSEQTKAFELLNIDLSTEPKEIVEKIKEYVDSLYANGSISDYNEQTRKDLAITLGSAWGNAACKIYGWKWMGLRAEDEEYAAYYIVSPNHKFCCPPFSFILNILEGGNIGLDGRNDNTIMLLFNMLDGVETRQNASHNYMVLM